MGHGAWASMRYRGISNRVRGMGPIGNAYKGCGPLGQWVTSYPGMTWAIGAQGVWGTRGMGHIGIHGQWGTGVWAMGPSNFPQMSSCQKDVKLSKRCQMSKNETPGLWREGYMYKKLSDAMRFPDIDVNFDVTK